MGELPVEIIYDILSRMPVKSLDRFRCVCKEWCKLIGEPNLAIIQMKRAADELMPIMYKRRPCFEDPNPLTLFRIIECKEGTTTTTTIHEAKKKSVLEFESKGAFPNRHDVRGSCNGLLYLSKYCINDCKTTLSVIHPLRKELYVLPPLFQMRSSGLGFDASSNTFKMCVSVRLDIQKVVTVHTMVHVLGTDSWREIPQVPYYRMMHHGVFAHGYLNWLGYHNQNPYATWLGCASIFPSAHRLKVIRFDVRKEEFGLIDPPIKLGDEWVETKLVDLHGEVGLGYINIHSYAQELWVLKQNNEWVIQCRFEAKPPVPWDRMNFIAGIWNKSGDILVTADAGQRLFVYSLKSRSFHEVKLDGWEDRCETSIFMYRSSLFSVPGMKKISSSNLNVCGSKTKRGRKRKISIPSKVIYRFLNFC